MSNFEDMKRTFALPPMADEVEVPVEKVDGRTLRRTGRTTQLNTVVSPDFKNWLRMEAAQGGKSMAAVLDDMRVAYMRHGHE
jgi:hypothetical protein